MSSSIETVSVLYRVLPSLLETQQDLREADRWTEDDLIRYDSARCSIIKVGKVGKHDAGHILLTMMPREILLVRQLAVQKKWRCNGIGTALLESAKNMLGRTRRRVLRIPVRESDLDLQVWLRGRGIRCFDPPATNYYLDELTYWFEWYQ